MTQALYLDLHQNTTSVGLDSPTKLRNHLNRHGYALPYMLRGAEGFKSLQGGSNIRFDNLMKEVSTFRDIHPDEKQTWSNPQVTNFGTAHWRISLDEQNLNMYQVLLQSNEMSANRRMLYYVEEQAKIELRAAISFAHGLEDHLYQPGDFAEMELLEGRTPNSLMVFNNEMADGLFYSYRTAGGGNDQVLGIDTTVYDKWDNQRVSYSAVGALAAGHVFNAFDEILMDLRFAQIPGPDGAMLADNAYGMKACFTQKEGVLQFMNALRVNQDRFQKSSDPAYPHPLFDGIPMIRVEALETVESYPTAAIAASGSETVYGTYDDTTNSNAGARYHFQDFSKVQKAIHEARYFYKGEIKSPSNQVDVKIQPIQLYHNNICVERRCLGTVFPSANI